ncbi:hypothetical protein [Mesobacillus selenatarsenatis]|uniref:hypothetical protein n=1 Tax=Mesobacillus selenatarsenatis TaxID=388741 RepID=UPI0005A988D3|nr:hypothetical protein [Mesobacillus selenatarsenatis]
MKSFFDFIGRIEIEMCSRLPRNAESGDSDPAGGVEVSEFLGGKTSQASQGARRWSWIKTPRCCYPHKKTILYFPI